ncbi:MAG: DUF7305 domain-containing protein [Planctomycetota bacterium]|jgi:hypothetical protein
MKAIKRALRLYRRGSALSFVLSALVVLLAMGTGLLHVGLQNQLAVTRAGSEIVARRAADAGLTKALFEMNTMLQVTPWDDSTLPEALSEALANCDATVSYTVSEDGGVYRVESTGYSGEMERTVNSVLRLEGPFEYAIFGRESVALKNGATVDWYNYDADDDTFQVGTSSIEPGAVDLKNSVTINGDVVVGTGGDPDIVIDGAWATITGRTYAASRYYELPGITVPAYLGELPSQGTISNNTTITSSAKCDEIDLSSGKIVRIDGTVALYVMGGINLRNSAELQVVDESTNPDASLTLYLAGDIEVKNNGAVNNLSEDASRVKIYGLDSCRSIVLKNGTDFYGAIYAPNADVIMMNSANAYGSVVAKSFEQKNSAAFNYDAALRDVSTDDEALRFTVERWAEE